MVMAVIVMLADMVVTEGNKGGGATVGMVVYKVRGTPARHAISVVMLSIPLT